VSTTGRILYQARDLFRRSRQTRWAMMSQIVTSGANFATTIIIVRSLGLEAFGRFSVCFLLMMITRSFLNGMVLLPMSTVGPKLSAISRPAYIGFLAVNGLAFSLFSSLLLVLLTVPLGIALNAPWLPTLGLSFALANFTSNGSDFLRRYHFVYEAPVWACAVDIVRFAVQIVLLVLLMTFWRPVFSVDTALYAVATGGLIGGLLGALNYGRISWSWRLIRVTWPRHWNFIKWMTPNVALEVTQNSGLVLLGGAYLGETALGGVRAMQNLANIINLPFNSLQQIAPSLASRAFKNGGRAGMRRFLTIMAGWSLAAVLTISVGVLSLAGPLIKGLLDLPVDENLPILLLFCLMNALIALRFPITVGIQSIEKPAVLVSSAIFSATVGLASVVLLANSVGAISIPISRVLVVLTSFFMLLYLSRHHLGSSRRGGIPWL